MSYITNCLTGYNNFQIRLQMLNFLQCITATHLKLATTALHLATSLPEAALFPSEQSAIFLLHCNISNIYLLYLAIIFKSFPIYMGQIKYIQPLSSLTHIPRPRLVSYSETNPSILLVLNIFYSYDNQITISINCSSTDIYFPYASRPFPTFL